MSALDYFSKAHPFAHLRSRLALRARRKIYNLFCELICPSSSDTVIDLGATPDVELVDSNFFEQFYPHLCNVTAVSIENIEVLEEIYVGLKTIRVSEGPLPFKDNQFDVLFCSAVIEHVGSYKNQVEFLKETIRVSKRFFLTTPNRLHPVEFHTILPLIHWLPKKIHRRVLKFLGYEFLSKEENLNLLTVSEIKKMLPEESIKLKYIWFAGFPSNIIIYGGKDT